MIKIYIRLDEAGIISGIEATGHSEAAAKGQDIVCASASVLLRTLGRALESEEGVSLSGSADNRGEFFLDIGFYSDTVCDWLKGITSFIVTGLQDLEAEYPGYCTVSIKKR